MILNFSEFHKQNHISNELDEIRIDNFNNFQKKGFPSKKEESWKYTDLNKIIIDNLRKLEIPIKNEISHFDNNQIFKNFKHNYVVFVNGIFIKTFIDFEDEKKINIEPLRSILKDKKKFEKIKNFFFNQQNSLISLNHALVNDGLFMEVKDNYSFSKPLVIYNFFDQEVNNKILNNKFFISLGKKSKLTIVEYHNANNDIKYFNNSSHHYLIEKDSILKRYSLNCNLDNSFNYHLTNVKSYSNSIFENFLYSSGSAFIKNEIHCDLLENFSSCFINGLVFLNNKQHHELKTNINHKNENCKSSQLVKGVMLDNSSGTYQGKIYVDKNAQKTDGYQLSKALVLSKNSCFNSKPELEIYADDVKCSHGSTTGNIDKNSVFYLMSRGLLEEQAKKMLVEGFLLETIETITDTEVKSLILKLFIEKIHKTKLEINEH